MHAAHLLVGALLAFGISIVCTPAGVSGAVFLLPVQLSVLDVPNPSLTPTNLLYNVIATPGALLRFRRRRGLRSRLARLLVLGAAPGVVLGAVLRVEVLGRPQVFLLVVSAVLGPLGAWLLLGPRPGEPRSAGELGAPAVVALAAAVGVIGGVYGIGGGSILGPLLAAAGLSLYAVAPAALLCSFATSVVGIAAFALLALLHGDASIAPAWDLGIAMGLGGAAGGYAGALLQPRIPEAVLRRLLGALALALAARYLTQALTS